MKGQYSTQKYPAALSTYTACWEPGLGRAAVEMVMWHMQRRTLPITCCLSLLSEAFCLFKLWFCKVWCTCFLLCCIFTVHKVKCLWKFCRMEMVSCIYSFIDWEPSSCCQSNWEAVNVLERVSEDVRMNSGRHNLTWIKFSVAGVPDGDRTNRSWSGTSGSISTNTSRQPFSVLCLMNPKYLLYTLHRYNSILFIWLN